MRDAFDALPRVELGEWYPVTVTANGRTQRFIAMQRSISGRGVHSAIRFMQIEPGRMLTGLQEQMLARIYKLDGRNQLTEESVQPASEAQLSRWDASWPSAESVQAGAEGAAVAPPEAGSSLGQALRILLDRTDGNGSPDGLAGPDNAQARTEIVAALTGQRVAEIEAAPNYKFRTSVPQVERLLYDAAGIPAGNLAARRAPFLDWLDAQTGQQAPVQSIEDEEGETGGLRFSRAGRQPEAFVTAPDGSIDFGEITPEMAQAMRRQAGKIRLERGDDSYGERHIELRHGDDIRRLGFSGVSDFVADIARNINQVWQPGKTPQLVAIHELTNDRVLFVELRAARDEAGDYYTVRSAFPARKGFVKNKGWELLWEDGRAQPSTNASSSAPFAVPAPNDAGGPATIPSGQSSDSTVAQPRGGSEPAPAAAGQQPPYAGAPAEESGQGAPIARGQSNSSIAPPDADGTPSLRRSVGPAPTQASPITRATLRETMAARFPSLAGAVDAMLARGDQGKRGGLVVIESRDKDEIARIITDKTGDATNGRQFRSQAGHLQGSYDNESGITFLFAPNLTAETVPAVLLHEVTHGQQRARIDAKAMELIGRRDKLAVPLRRFLSRVAGRMMDAGEANNQSEAAAYIVEQAVLEGRQAGFSAADGKLLNWIDMRLGKPVGDIVRAWAAMIRAWGMRHGFYPRNLTVDDLVAFAQAGVRQAARGDVLTEEDDGRQASRPDLAAVTQSENFGMWFADSKMKTKEGKPIVFMHGSPNEFEAFDNAKLGLSSNHATTGLGHFFTRDKGVAEKYADGGHIYRGWLRMENPYVMKLSEAQAIEDPQAAAKRREALKRQGRDGIIMLDDAGKPWAFVVFEPWQFKSTDNRGTFDEFDERFRFSRTNSRVIAHDRIGRTSDKPLGFLTVDGSPDIWQLPPDVTSRTQGRFLAKPVRILNGRQFGRNRGFGLTHIVAEHGAEIERTGLTPEQWVVSVIANTERIYDDGAGRLLVQSVGTPRGVAYLELRDDGGYYSVVTAYDGKPRGKLIWSGRRQALSTAGSGDTANAVTTTAEPSVSPSAETAQSPIEPKRPPETLADQTSDENVADRGADGNLRFSRAGRTASAISDQAQRLYERATGQQRSNQNDPFRAENTRLREQDRTLWNKAKQQLRRWLSPGGLLPDAVFAEKIKRDSEFQAVEFDVRHAVGGLERAVKQDYGVPFDKLTDAQQRALSEALAGKVPAGLPEATRAAVVAMRQYIDSLSGEYLTILQSRIDALMVKAQESSRAGDAAAAINEIELYEKIRGNIGAYVHRSYQAFDDPTWFRKVPTSTLNAARRYLRDGYMEDGKTSEAEALRLAEVTLNEILKNGTAYDSMESFIAEGKLGAKDLSVLTRRKNVPPEIRALLGEYTDPRLNFTKSATKMGRLIWNQRFLDRVREIGVGTFLFEGRDRPPAATTQIAAEGSEVYAPLNGLWTFPEVAQAFKDALAKEKMSDLYRFIVRANGLVKYGKTVLSPTTAMRNWQSAMFFALANGHFDLSQMRKSVAAFREQVRQNASGDDLAYLRHLKRLGVVYDTPYAGEMMRYIEDAKADSGVDMVMRLFGASEGAIAKGLRGVKQINQIAQGFYSFGDDFWKIIGFENEKANLMKAGMSLAEAEREAAQRIRNTYPTYSMVGAGVRWLSRFPLMGTFVSFPAEIVRTTANMLRITAADLKSDNPAIRAMGMKRAVGMAMVSGMFYGLAALTKAMAGVDDDEEEALRDLAPEWQKNSTFLFAGRDEKGNLRYFDMSFLDPYGYWKRPITAMLRDQPWEDAAASAVKDMLTPFFGADIATSAIFQVLANKKETGGKVYQENAAAFDQAGDIANHLRKALQPGFVGNVERLTLAAQGVRREGSGQPYDMEDEMVALLGWRASTMDPKTALYYRSFEFNDAMTEARQVLTRTLRSVNAVSPEDIREARTTAQRQQTDAFTEMHRLVQAARAAGMNPFQIRQVLQQSGISRANAAALVRGTPPPLVIGTQAAGRAVQQARVMEGPEFAKEVAKRFREDATAK